MQTGIRHIAVMRLSAMGDVAICVPVVRALRQQYPALAITIVTRPFFRPFFRNIDDITFYAYDPKTTHKGLSGIYKLYTDLKRMSVDGFADLHNVLRSRIAGELLSFSGIPVARIDKARRQKKALTRMTNKVFEPLPHTYLRYAKVFENLGFRINMDNPVFPAKSVLAESMLQVTGRKEGIWIGIAPFAQHDSKVYPADLMKEVLSGLSKKADKIFLFGGGTDEIIKLNSFAKPLTNVIVVAGKFDLNGEMDLISQLDLMVSMDSGNAHIAAMLGVKVVTIWGNTHPFAGFAPFNQPPHYAITADRSKYPGIPTSVYGNKIVQGYEDAMRSISPATIVQTIDEALQT